MRNLLIPVALLCVCAMALPASADQYMGAYTMTQTGGNRSWSVGGEFTVYGGGNTINTPGALSNSAYNTQTKNVIQAQSFQTFCIEGAEYEYNGYPIDVVMSTDTTGSRAIWGGLQGAGDYIQPETAFLYELFATANLPGYVYGSTASAGNLQRAIWAFEEEEGYHANGDNLDADAKVFFDYAKANLASKWLSIASVKNSPGQIGGVRVLNIWADGTYANHPGIASGDFSGASSYLRQDQLYLDHSSGATPAPAAVVLGLIGLSLVGIKMRRLA
jgi:hypothetical protein